MLWLISKLIALGLAAAIAPMIFTASILLISDEKNPVRKLLAFLAGGAVVALILAFVAIQVWEGNFSFSSSVPVSDQKSMTRIGLGILSIIAAIYILLYPKKSEIKLTMPDSLPLIFGFGFFLYATNFKALLISLVALHEILVSDISFSLKLVYTGVFDLLFLIPSLFPLLVYTLVRKDAEKFIRVVRNFFNKYGASIVAIICFGFGIWLLLGN